MSSVTSIRDPDPSVCLAGMDGAALAAIASPAELVVKGLTQQQAVTMFNLLQAFKQQGVPESLLNSPRKTPSLQ